MKDCANCGEPLADDAEVCVSCGQKVGATESYPPAPVVEQELAAEPVADQGPVLVVRKGPDVGERFYMDRSRLIIGRDPESDIFLNDVTVSRTHAVLTCVSGKVSVEDADSLNGTYINGVLVAHAELTSGDSLQIGRFQMVFLAGGGA